MKQAINPLAQKLITKLATTILGMLMVLVGSTAIAQSSNLNLNNIRFANILDEHDVAMGAMLTIIQDAQGFIWFGGIGGLARYDGHDLHIVGDTDNANESIKSVHDIVEDGDIIWLATSYGLIKFDRRTEQYVRYTADAQSEIKISQNYINKVAILPNGKIMLATYGGFDVIDPKTKQVQTLFPDAANANSHFVFALKVDDTKSRILLEAVS